MHVTPWWRSSDLASPLFSRRAETVSWPASLVTACVIQGSLPDELKKQDLAEALCVCVCVCVCVCLREVYIKCVMEHREHLLECSLGSRGRQGEAGSRVMKESNPCGS